MFPSENKQNPSALGNTELHLQREGCAFGVALQPPPRPDLWPPALWVNRPHPPAVFSRLPPFQPSTAPCSSSPGPRPSPGWTYPSGFSPLAAQCTAAPLGLCFQVGSAFRHRCVVTTLYTRVTCSAHSCISLTLLYLPVWPLLPGILYIYFIKHYVYW